MDCPVWHSPHPKSLGWCVSCGWRAPETPPRNLAADLDALTQRVAALEAERTPQSGPPAAPSLLPCPFCGAYPRPEDTTDSAGEPWVVCGNEQCGNRERLFRMKEWNRRPPADARLRALALEVADSATPGNIADLRAYLRETAR